MIKPEAIRTERLDLLPLSVDHADEMAVVLGDPDLYTFTGDSPSTATELRERYERQVAGSPDPAVSWLNLVLRLRAEDCLVGYVQSTVNPADGADGTDCEVAEIAWVVGTPWQRRGLAAEAAKGLADWLAQQPSVRTVIAHIHPDHRASAAVATAAGLTATEEWFDGEIKWQREIGAV